MRCGSRALANCSHSPEIRPDGQGGYLLFHVGAGANITAHCPDPSAHTCQYVSNCSGGTTGPDHPIMSGLDFYGPSVLYRSSSVDGPWTAVDIGLCDQVPGCEKTATYRGNGNDMNREWFGGLVLPPVGSQVPACTATAPLKVNRPDESCMDGSCTSPSMPPGTAR